MVVDPQEAIVVVEGLLLELFEVDHNKNTGEEEGPEDYEGQQSDRFEYDLKGVGSPNGNGNFFLYGLKQEDLEVDQQSEETEGHAGDIQNSDDDNHKVNTEVVDHIIFEEFDMA